MSALAKKLRWKSGQKALVVKKPKDVVLEPPEGAKLSNRGKGPFDMVLGFAQDTAAVAEIFPRLRDACAEDGALWIAYPKKSSGIVTDISRDEGWGGLTKQGWAAVTQIALDGTWSALRFRYAPELIRERKKRGW